MRGSKLTSAIPLAIAANTALQRGVICGVV
jgi:hypothetical protein